MNKRPDPRQAMIESRAGGNADVPALARLRAAFWSDQIAKGSIDNPDTEPARLLEDTSKLIGRARTFLLLAAHDGKAVGYVLGQTKIVPGAADSAISSIEEIFIEPAFRNMNVAQDLVDRMIAQFRTAGAQRIQLRVLENNAEGRLFWQRIGFSPSVTIYEYAKSGDTNR